MNLNDLYQDAILDHNRSPRNYHIMLDADCSAKGFNPLCGDKIQLYLKFDDDKISAASFQGGGCAIATASASLMTEFVIGKTLEEAQAMFHKFKDALTGQQKVPLNLGKLNALAGVKEFPARVKCATLAWHTLQAALQKNQQAVSTE